MGRPTDTNDIRTYIMNHLGGVFDVNYLSKKVFDKIPVANFRKYVTRLEQEGLLRKISKGLYMIGESSLDDTTRLINHYVGNGYFRHGLIGGSQILNEVGFPNSKVFLGTVIYSNLAIGIKHLEDFGFSLIESHSNYSESMGGYNINLALELINNRRFVADADVAAYYKKIHNLLSSYRDDYFEYYVDFTIYKRWVFNQLALYLEAMHISNEVREIYAYKTRYMPSKE